MSITASLIVFTFRFLPFEKVNQVFEQDKMPLPLPGLPFFVFTFSLFVSVFCNWMVYERKTLENLIKQSSETFVLQEVWMIDYYYIVHINKQCSHMGNENCAHI